MTYSSAIFNHTNESLESAQCNKYNRLLDKINKSRANILEVGCGWGGFAELAGLRGHKVKGITLSNEQHGYARERTKHLDVDIVLEDYRHQHGKYDVIVSIEMLEAVGEKYWNTYFNKLSQLINDDGQIFIQVITIDDNVFDSYRKSADMIRTFIFPGGMLPSECVLQKVATANNLQITDIYRFGKDYAKTLRIWLDVFDSRYAEIKELGFDDEFIRIWRFYLTLCSAGFDHGRINVVQLELSKINRGE
jgi:cyclopropane-fatty-acyl-phospholipid synthase